MSLAHHFINDPITGLAALDHFFDDAFNSRRSLRAQEVDAFRPRMDIHYDTDANNVNVAFDLPGLKKEDVSIDVHNSILTVSGETGTSSERSEGGYVVRERRHGKFTRSLQLPQGLKNEEIKASMANGVLTIVFPKSTPETEPRKVTIA